MRGALLSLVASAFAFACSRSRSCCARRAFNDGQLLLVLGGATGFLGALERFARLGFVEVLTADGRIGEDRDDLWLHLEDAAGNEDKLLLAAARGCDFHRPGLDPGDKRRVARIDAELARFAGQNDE